MPRNIAGVSALALMMAFGPLSANAQPDIEPIINSRLRYEFVDQNGLPEQAHAVTWRNRLGLGWQVSPALRLEADGEFVAHLSDRFNDTTNGRIRYPVVADPDVAELNRLQLSYTARDNLDFTLGRQRLIRGDARYVGNVGFRQNEQTFDAVEIEARFGEDWTLSYAYLDRVHRILGDDHLAGEWDLDTHLLDVTRRFAPGRLTVSAILMENESIARLSSDTWVVNWTGQGAFGHEGIRYFLEYANQSDNSGSLAGFDLDLWRGEMSWRHESLGLVLGGSVLEGNGQRGFSTPLATLHKFQGFADAFLATPANGLEDIYLGARWFVTDPAFGQAMNMSLVWHDFSSEQSGRDLGQELDAVVNWRQNQNWSWQAKFALFDGEPGGPASRDKVMIGLTYAY